MEEIGKSCCSIGELRQTSFSMTTGSLDDNAALPILRPPSTALLPLYPVWTSCQFLQAKVRLWIHSWRKDWSIQAYSKASSAVVGAGAPQNSGIDTRQGTLLDRNGRLGMAYLQRCAAMTGENCKLRTRNSELTIQTLYQQHSQQLH